MMQFAPLLYSYQMAMAQAAQVAGEMTMALTGKFITGYQECDSVSRWISNNFQVIMADSILMKCSLHSFFASLQQ